MVDRRMALIVANDEYDHAELRRLQAPAADADALCEVLADTEIGGFSVEVVQNEPAHVAQSKIEDLFSESRSSDVLLLHFSCHGLKSESGELFFAARNTKPNRLGSTAIAADFVQRCMRLSRSRSIVLFLDCCYAGAFSQGVTVRATSTINVLDSFPTGKQGGGRNRAVITASSAMEYAFESEQLAEDPSARRPSVFTAALVEGLSTGEADRDEDGLISLNELYDYVFDRVREQNPNQTPSRSVEMQGDLYIARSRRHRIVPDPIPPDLEAARTDANLFTKMGAVAELRARLVGDNLPVAAGAADALAETARTDIRYVAAIAETALREAAVQPSQPTVQFGAVALGSPGPHHAIRLLGPPIARACGVRALDSWIHALVTPDGVDVSIDTDAPGRHHGLIEFTGYLGKATVAIDVHVAETAEASPPPPPDDSPPEPETQPASRVVGRARVPVIPVIEGPAPETPETDPVDFAPAPNGGFDIFLQTLALSTAVATVVLGLATAAKGVICRGQPPANTLSATLCTSQLMATPYRVAGVAAVLMLVVAVISLLKRRRRHHQTKPE